ncbi:hypothetical protein M1K46_06750 [Fictibacillus sp. WQ 8-8]|uniref:Uncharacterized protein n=1 Tax=Fictibacillus marinisediminis TaxID=2878389 RepID=A0A9X1X995_9BACL|nr:MULTISPECIES: hypothetical protein [Fictibacillus]SFE03355.1 hypothetical protein SAMN05428981_103170 [Bacillus sp. OV194]MCK6256567.1 hypothetical protein [Fictibacillus marinisediminis]MCQ6265359.1 hypothetical protein [Fictibacillus sp. WQ 8-8]MED2972029.1 hypothetical protein [Fictibacillus sp. B-59209]UZJ77553.1 hypothetical protein OKX00_15410 [Fictibacillus sp. KU28468]
MKTIKQEDIQLWVENHLEDFKNFTPYLFTQEFIHFFCESRQNEKEFEVKYDKSGQKLYMRYLEPSEIEDDWVCVGNVSF